MEQCLFQVDVQRILLCFSLFKNQSLVSLTNREKRRKNLFHENDIASLREPTY